MRFGLAIVLLAILPVAALAQAVPQGASPEAVTKILGAPRSRTAAKEREIWLYPGYQVVFEKGRVTALTPLPADGGSVEWQKRSPVPEVAGRPSSMVMKSAAPSSTGTMPPRSSPDATAAGATRPRNLVPTLANAEVDKASIDRRRPPAKTQGTAWSRIWPYLLLSAVVAGGLWWAYVKVRNWLLQTFPFLRRKPEPSERTEQASKGGVTAAPALAVATASTETKPPTLADWELTGELLRSLEWKRFELLVQRFFASSGFRTKAVGVGADNGADIYLFRAGSLKPLGYVQCRLGGNRRVDEVQVRVLFGIMAGQEIPEGTMVTTGGFEPEALMFGRQNRLNLLSGDEFLGRFNRLPTMVRARILEEVTTGDFTTPTCPRCGGKLALSSGDTDGVPVWACKKFPRCRYTMNAPSVAGTGVASA